jgi:hypothetical protein
MPSNQSILIHHLELIKVLTIPTTNQQGPVHKKVKHGKVDKKKCCAQNAIKMIEFFI